MKNFIINKLKENPRIISLVISVVVIVPTVIYYSIVATYGIIFTEDITYVQYGDEFSYDTIISEVIPEDAVIQYPDIEIVEVGVYDLTFTYTYGSKEVEQNHTIRVVDTQGPQIVLKLDEDEPIEIPVDYEFSPFVAISEVLYMPEFDESSYPECELLDDESYNQRIVEIEAAYETINQRIIDNSGEMESIDVEGNTYFYKTDLNVSEVGTYTMELCIVDNNYNYVTLTKEIDVLESNSYFNTGGKVVCDYIEALPEVEAYKLYYYETYTYDIYKLVTNAHFYTKLEFYSDYDTTDNLTTLYDASIEKFDLYNDYDGVETVVKKFDGYITIHVYIDFSIYDKASDPLEIIKTDGSGEIKISTLIASITDASCTAE